MGKALGLTLVFVSALILGGCSGPKVLTTSSNGGDVRVDGNLNEWSSDLASVSSDAASVGIRHDDDFTYIAFATQDEGMMRQILSAGMTFWLNNTADEAHQYGIEYPLARRPERQTVGEAGAPSAGNRPAFLSEFALIAPDGTRTIHQVEAVSAFKLEAYAEFGSFTYELRIERRSDFLSFDPPVVAGQNMLGFGITTGVRPSTEEGRQATGAASGGGGRGGGRGGRRGGGRGGGGGGGGGGSVEPVDLWFLVQLPGAS